MAVSKLGGENSHHENQNNGMEDNLQRIRTAGTVSISAELFEKLYLSPQNVVKGDLRKTFGNPTPIALIGFLIALTPLSCDLMGWRGAGGNGAASIGSYYFFGGLLQLISGVLEWILGNTYSSVVFSAYGAFFLSYASTLNPSFAAFSTYAPAGEDGSAGLATQGFNASFGFFTVWMGLLSLIFFICAFRTNICFVFIFFTLALCFSLLTGAYFLLAADYAGNSARAAKLVTAAGASSFVTCVFGWWVFFAIMVAVMDFPLSVPVGDLSTLIKPASAKNNV